MPAPKSLKALARDGIPAELRPTLWFQLSGGLALKKAAAPNYYRSLTRLGSKDAKLGGISSSDADMFRTFRQALCCRAGLPLSARHLCSKACQPVSAVGFPCGSATKSPPIKGKFAWVQD